MTDEARVYGGKSGEERRDERRSRLIEAGLELLGTQGLAATTLRKVCHTADLPSRYFYENFADVDALNVAVYDAVIEELIGRGLTAIAQAPADLPSKVRAALGCAIDFAAEDPRRGRVTLSLVMASPPLAQRHSETTERIATMIADLGRDYVLPATSRAEVLTISRFFVGGFTQLLTVWIDDPDAAARGELLDNCTQLFMAITANILQTNTFADLNGE
ncbi:MAG: TetR/AcrR family transcriptional regulator [Mycobacterium sp.]